MINPYFKSMFYTYNLRRSCFVCPFKRIEREADITLADCWGASRLVPQIDDNKGLSSVIVHSDKGLSLWSKVVSMVDSVELPLEEIVKGNTNLIENRTCDYKKEVSSISCFILSIRKKHFSLQSGKELQKSQIYCAE